MVAAGAEVPCRGPAARRKSWEFDVACPIVDVETPTVSGGAQAGGAQAGGAHAGGAHAGGAQGQPRSNPGGDMSRPDFSRAPMTLAWEVTRACPLRCVHCRADAQHHRDARELSTEEGAILIDQAAAMGTRVFVLTGGDPLARPDIFDLIAHATSTGMYVGFSPSVTGRLRSGALERAVAAGTGTVHLSLDGATPATHDAFRGIGGHFERTRRAIDAACALGARLQIATTVSRRNIAELAAIARLLDGRVDSWTLFFLVMTGRAQAADTLTAAQEEHALHWLASGEFSFTVRTVEAPQFRRVRAQLGLSVAPGVTDGNGFCFVSHVGGVQPSGFLPVTVGNVRDRPLRHWYRDHPVFRALRDPSQRGGTCGRCEFLAICGGSRARAWAATGDLLAADPTCAHVPSEERSDVVFGSDPAGARP
ncbi:MAG: radical SAM protein [Acidimicrobiales bacterium]